MPTRLIAFDLDGTLIDSRLDLTESANELLAAYGEEPLSEQGVSTMIGDGARMLVRRVLGSRRLTGERVDLEAALRAFLEIYSRRLLDNTRLYPGVAEAIESVKAHARLAVLTNKPEAPTRTILRALLPDSSFDWVIGGDSAFPRKPDPAALEHLMDLAGVGASEALLVGDSTVDIETARRAGVRACAALYGFGQSRGQLALNQEDIVVRDSQKLGEALGRWLNAT
jgi:phosphoglycolate phosphatase